MKVCAKCKKEKELSEYHKNKNKKDGYSDTCKVCIKTYQKEYNKRKDVIERNKKYSKVYREMNEEKLKKYREENRDKLLKIKKEWHIKNKEYAKEYKKQWRKMKQETDPIYNLYMSIGAMIRKSFNYNGFKKNSRTHEILGCDFEFFKEYIESQFDPWMNWYNRGLYDGEYESGWDIDHIIELKTVETQEDVIRLNYYTNLRPLDSKINRVDRNYGKKE